jgi:hypothetical protein
MKKKMTELILTLLTVGTVVLTSGCGRESEPDPLVRPCGYNLRIIHGAKEQFAVQYSTNGTPTISHTNGSPVVVADLVPFVKMGNPEYFKCPTGPDYIVGPIGTRPRCPAHGTVEDIFSNQKRTGHLRN